MATAGPETDIARAAIPVEEAVAAGSGIDLSTSTTGAPPPVENVQAQAPGGQAVNDPLYQAQLNAQAIQQGMQPQQPAPGAPVAQPGDQGPFRLKVSEPQLRQDVRYTQQDFYTPNPQIQATDPTGRPMYMPSFGEVPMGVLASRLQETQKRRAAIQQKREAFRLDSEIKDTAPQYQQEFTNYAQKTLNSFQQGVVDSFGGNRSAALDYLVNDPEGIRRWREVSAQINAIGTEVKDVVDQAIDSLENHRKGLETIKDPEMVRQMERVVAGYGALGTEGEPDLNMLIKDGRQLRRSMNASLYVKDRINPAIDAHFSQIMQRDQKKARWEKGMWVTDIETLKSFEQAAKGYARDMVMLDIFDTVAEAEKFLMDIFPDKVEVETKVQRPNKPSGGAGGPEDASKYVVSMSEVPYDKSTPRPLGAQAGNTYPTIAITDKGKLAAPRIFSKDGLAMTMHPFQFKSVDGEVLIYGKVTGLPKEEIIAAVRETDDGKGMSDEEFRAAEVGIKEAATTGRPMTKNEVIVFNALPLASVPMKENESLVAQMGYVPGMVTSALAKAAPKKETQIVDWNSLQ